MGSIRVDLEVTGALEPQTIDSSETHDVLVKVLCDTPSGIVITVVDFIHIVVSNSGDVTLESSRFVNHARFVSHPIHFDVGSVGVLKDLLRFVNICVIDQGGDLCEKNLF